MKINQSLKAIRKLDNEHTKTATKLKTMLDCHCNGKNKMVPFPEGQQWAEGHEGQRVPGRELHDG